jgi:rhamnulokinase
MNSSYLAVDIGASSGRHILGRVENGRIVLEEVYRFDNTQVRRGGHDCWDLDALEQNVLAGLAACRRAGKIPQTVGIDTWAVDFVLLDGAGRRLGDAVAYRDARTGGIPQQAEKAVPFARQYARTGIQKQPFNTVYQLLALQKEHPEQLAAARRLLMIPEYLNYRLTGRLCSEYTNATSTALVNAETKSWDDALIAQFGLPRGIFGALHLPGETVGRLTPAVQQKVGFDCTVVLPATHDTGSAFLAVPAQDENAVYLSSGTWSLLGVENPAPITSEASCMANFTNEGGAWYRWRYLKNIMGLWMIQSVRRELNGVSYVRQDGPAQEPGHPGHPWGFQDLIAAAELEGAFPSVVDVDDESFLAPVSMMEAVRAFCRRTGQPEPKRIGEVMQCIYRSLARRYAQAIAELSALTGKTYAAIHIVGGGCQDQYLNQLTADAAGLPVLAGPVEGTALGNLMVQMIAAGEFADLAEARAAVRASFPIRRFEPKR